MDLDSSGEINYSEFLEAASDRRAYLTEQNLLFAFNHFDLNGNGAITEEEFVEAFRREGRVVSADEIKASLMSAGDLDSTGDITFEEFKLVMQKLR